MRPSRLKNWRAVRRVSGRTGRVQEYLVGEVYGDPHRADGSLIRTTHVVRREGRIAITASGSRYELDGDDDPLRAPGSIA